MTNLPAILSLAFLVHVCLVIKTGHSLFWCCARAFDALEAAQRATFLSLVPWWRVWRRRFWIEWRKLQTV